MSKVINNTLGTYQINVEGNIYTLLPMVENTVLEPFVVLTPVIEKLRDKNIWIDYDQGEGLGNLDPVLDYVDNTAVPPTFVSKDRYILDNTVGIVNPAWGACLANDIVEFNGIAWIPQTPQDGQTAFVVAKAVDYMFVLIPTPHWVQKGSASSTYANPAATSITVGGYPAGSTFPAPKTMQEMWDGLMYPELFPTLTNPSATLGLAQAGYREIGEQNLTLTFTATFNRGSISPAYGTSGLRSGLPNTYRYTGTGLPANQASASLSNSQTVLNYTVLVGTQSWTGLVSYDIGEQPLSSNGNPYSTPLPAGNTASSTATITGVFPYFATTSNIITPTIQPLTAMNSIYVETSMALEDDFAHKQTIDFPADVSGSWNSITGVQFFNTVSNAWEWLNGTKANSLLNFTVTGTTHLIQGNTIDYNRFTNNSAKIGARMLRWYTN